MHALQIEGAMEPVSKWLLSLAGLAATIVPRAHQRLVRPWPGRRRTAA